VKQVQAWLGHADPGFTLKTYIHLMDAGVGSAAFLDRAVATESPETGASEAIPKTATGTRPLSKALA
jgi:hypothetical protein